MRSVASGQVRLQRQGGGGGGAGRISDLKSLPLVSAPHRPSEPNGFCSEFKVNRTVRSPSCWFSRSWMLQEVYHADQQSATGAGISKQPIILLKFIN